MPDIFDYNKHNGVLERWDYDQMTGRAYVNRTQDLRLWRKMVTELRNTGRADKGLMDGGREFHHAYTIPATVQLELHNKGIDIFSKDPQMQKRMIHELETNYPACKVSDKKLV